MADDQLLRNLQAITGDDATWEGFDPASWRSFQSDGEDEDETEAGVEATGGASLISPDDDYASDDSAGMIFNFHKLTAAEKAQSRGGACKLSKARQYASGEVAYSRELEDLEKVEWKETGLAMGDVSADGTLFVAWRLVQNYPDMFVGKTNGIRAAPLFTLDALHEGRVWDIYYVHCPPEMNRKPVMLVPTYQFEHFLDVVNAKLETRFTIPPGRNEERFMMTFGMGNSPRPRFLGRSDNSESFRALHKAIPAPHEDDNLAKATSLGLDEFKQLLNKTRADRKKEKKSDRNRPKRIKAHQEWGRSIKRVQRYLGLRGRVTDDAADKLANLDLNLSMVEDPENSVLFVAIDIEAWEQNHDLITEVGIAILDTAEIKNIAPGNDGQNWFQHIDALHIRVKENSWAVNRRYVHGCPDYFNFGTSEFTQGNLIEPLIKNLIDKATFIDPVDGTTKPRPVVLVFHESSSDIKYLKSLSYYVEGAQNVIDVADTREMHQYLVRSNNSASLASVLDYLGISYRHLHNAGNDAVYTLQAMVGLAVKKRAMSIENAQKKPEGHVPYSDFKQKEKEGWTSGEDTDGGNPVGLPDTDIKANLGSEDAGGQGWD
ncbi:hypothetical protein C8A00DRAFT_29034 [Chaetomidium leptoderma]|uniref:Gfd2/YDR514C-like C-terminal domain-containing protein n=1 Tax=Chaetomidium leptoderma TaxID=669021 RepID=A0AAN6VUL3_9PEZI|nr:hypothetical protein C8A00DRAFT_29034 [Chaetomidium leptoderma]